MVTQQLHHVKVMMLRAEDRADAVFLLRLLHDGGSEDRWRTRVTYISGVTPSHGLTNVEMKYWDFTFPCKCYKKKLVKLNVCAFNRAPISATRYQFSTWRSGRLEASVGWKMPLYQAPCLAVKLTIFHMLRWAVVMMWQLYDERPNIPAAPTTCLQDRFTVDQLQTPVWAPGSVPLLLWGDVLQVEQFVLALCLLPAESQLIRCRAPSQFFTQRASTNSFKVLISSNVNCKSDFIN